MYQSPLYMSLRGHAASPIVDPQCILFSIAENGIELILQVEEEGENGFSGSQSYCLLSFPTSLCDYWASKQKRRSQWTVSQLDSIMIPQMETFSHLLCFILPPEKWWDYSLENTTHSLDRSVFKSVLYNNTHPWTAAVFANRSQLHDLITDST